MSSGYEASFGLTERPFSLTSDPRFFFKSRAHGRALETLTFGLRSKERFLLVTGDLGIGKTMLCRTLLEQLRRRMPAAYVANPLMSPDAFERLLVEDFALPSLDALDTMNVEAVVIVDEAHTVPGQLLQHLLSFSRRHLENEYLFRFAFVGQSTSGDPARLGVPEIDDRIGTKVRLLPLGREECAAYIEHRLNTAGPNHTVRFSAKTHDYVFSLSGGVPRLVNLLCECALQHAASTGTHNIEPTTIDTAAAALQLLRARPRRFRWFTKRVS
jgi:type II secretory pathway predicted ATPase ExeA